MSDKAKRMTYTDAMKQAMDDAKSCQTLPRPRSCDLETPSSLTITRLRSLSAGANDFFKSHNDSESPELQLPLDLDNYAPQLLSRLRSPSARDINYILNRWKHRWNIERNEVRLSALERRNIDRSAIRGRESDQLELFGTCERL